MENEILKDLNKEQKEAVLQLGGPIIILAGAGSGKTRCITAKVMYLISKGVDPFNILCITFTNKAAGEMRDRISSQTTDIPTVSTFHAFCAKVLRIDGVSIGISRNYVIYDEADQIDTAKEALNLLSLSPKEYKPSSVLSTISQAKNQMINPDEYRSIARGHFQEVVSSVYKVYQSILKENGALDFDDILLKTIELFKKNPEVLQKYQNRFKYILIDEYQDTNLAQYQLTKMLAAKWGNICVVGDFSQSIYSWRGADFTNLSKFKQDFKDTKTFSLSQNYRSTQKILDGAHAVISKNTSHPVLDLWTENSEGEELVVFEARNEQDEGEFIIGEIAKYRYQNPNTKLFDIAVLYRTNAQSRVLEEILLHHSIPYTLIGGTRFYDRKEVKDVLAYLRVLENPKDKVSYQRLEKIGKGRLQKFENLKEELNKKELATIELLDQILQKTGYLTLYDERDEDDRIRLENIKELRSVAIAFPKLTEFLENVALVEQEYMPDHPKKDEEKPDAITLMTLHAAKGLEFPLVFIVGMEEGIFPHSRSLMDREELEEERRLCYVGMTRAKSQLYLTYARKRLFFGQKTSNIVSRFIIDLPKEIVQNIASQTIDFL